MPMRSRFRLWLKKRGGRRSGSPRTALAAELLYHSVFVGVGAVALWLHVNNVLAPQQRLRSQLADYEQAECEVVDKQATGQMGLTGWEYQPECLVQLSLEGRSLPPVWAMAADASPSKRTAEENLQRFTVGQTAPCWYDPDDPNRVTLTLRRRWWPWLVTLIPLSLIVLGAVGMTRSVLRAGVSPERRQAVAQSATRLEAMLAPNATPAGVGLPDTTAVTDSPGVRLRYRLPSLGDAGWRIATLATICVAWNLLVAFFLAGLGIDLWAGRMQWTLALAIAPLAMGGLYLIALLYYEARSTTGIGLTSVEVSDHPLLPGERYQGALIQTGQFKLRGIHVALVCEELATYCEGTDTRTSVLEVYRKVVLHHPRLEVTTSKPLECEFEFEAPAHAMHSFHAPHNEVRWSLEARISPLRWPAFRRRFLVCVYPAELTPSDARAAEALA